MLGLDSARLCNSLTREEASTQRAIELAGLRHSVRIYEMRVEAIAHLCDRTPD